jgi:hypothetical protein
MKYRSKQILSRLAVVKLRRMPAFSLVEAVTALIILALTCSSVLLVINRCMASAADSEIRMQAFEVARDNMEALLSEDVVSETVEYGNSFKYPEIKWQTTVEVFYEPTMAANMQIWVRGICSAEYTDAAGQDQKIELTHWLTSLTREQLLNMLKQKFSGAGEPNSMSEPNEPNMPSDSNEPNNPSVPKSPCDTLPFCERIKCLLDAGVLGKPTNAEMVRCLKECP